MRYEESTKLMAEDGSSIHKTSRIGEPEKPKEMKRTMVSQTELNNGQGQMSANLPSAGSLRRTLLVATFLAQSYDQEANQAER